MFVGLPVCGDSLLPFKSSRLPIVVPHRAPGAPHRRHLVGVTLDWFPDLGRDAVDPHHVLRAARDSPEREVRHPRKHVTSTHAILLIAIGPSAAKVAVRFHQDPRTLCSGGPTHFRDTPCTAAAMGVPASVGTHQRAHAHTQVGQTTRHLASTRRCLERETPNRSPRELLGTRFPHSPSSKTARRCPESDASTSPARQPTHRNALRPSRRQAGTVSQRRPRPGGLSTTSGWPRRVRVGSSAPVNAQSAPSSSAPSM